MRDNTRIDLLGKTVIVTGSGGLGSGRAEARRLAAEGCQVVVSDIDEAGGQETLQLIVAGGGRADFFRCDVSVAAEVEALVAFAEHRFGGLDILVNNASAPYRPGAPIEQWYATIETDLFGAIHGVRYAIPAMRKRGGGVILNVSSTSALGHGLNHSGAPAYDIAKAGVIRLTTTLASLRGTDNIRVNCLVPDWVATPEVKSYWDALTPEQRRDPRIPPVLTSLDEIAQAVVSLITDTTLAGRVVVWWNRREPALISATDPGYGASEPYVGRLQPGLCEPRPLAKQLSKQLARKPEGGHDQQQPRNHRDDHGEKGRNTPGQNSPGCLPRLGNRGGLTSRSKPELSTLLRTGSVSFALTPASQQSASVPRC